MHPSTVFDKPQFKLLPDRKGARYYGNVDNCLEFTCTSGPVSGATIPVAVPAELFTFMREVANVQPGEEVTLAIDQVDEFYVFSMLVNNRLYDLWAYSDVSLPRFLFNTEYHIN